jgi:hypothetical protein
MNHSVESYGLEDEDLFFPCDDILASTSLENKSIVLTEMHNLAGSSSSGSSQCAAMSIIAWQRSYMIQLGGVGGGATESGLRWSYAPPASITATPTPTDTPIASRLPGTTPTPTDTPITSRLPGTTPTPTDTPIISRLPGTTLSAATTRLPTMAATRSRAPAAGSRSSTPSKSRLR